VGRVGGTGNPKKASCPTSRNRDPRSNTTKESDLHSEKHSQSKTSTDAGIMTSTKPVPENALLPMFDNLDPDSNITENSDLHSEKHSEPKTSTVQK
jgi:hypothetical protein